MNDLERMIARTTAASTRVQVPPAPGAIHSPQLPGEIPDRSNIPGHAVMPVPPVVGAVKRPATQYDTAAGRLGLLEPVDEDLEIADFEIGAVSNAEARNAYPWQAVANWPSGDFRLDRGTVAVAPGIVVEALPEVTAE